MTENAFKLSVRPAEKKDAETLAAFNQHMARETENRELDSTVISNGVSGGLERPDRCRYFVAEVDGKIAGQAMITFEWSDWRNGELWWLQSVYVLPEFRRRGVFTALYRHIEELGRKNPDVRGLRLYVEEDNRDGQAVYARLGMVHAGYHVYEQEF